MAWVTEYDLTWKSHTDWGYIYLQRDGGSYQMPLTLKAGSLEIRNIIPSWDDPIARMACTFSIVNDLSDFYTLMPLMTISNGQIRVVVTYESSSTLSSASSPQILFTGFLNCEAVSQVMQGWADIQLTASGYISKLENEYPTSIDTLQHMSLIDIINDCFSLTGSTDPIWVSIALYENNSEPGAGQTMLNRNAVFTELFWKNNFERQSALSILAAILRPINCCLFWNDEKWVIVHYESMDQARTYVIYEMDPSSGGYGYSDTGDVSTDTGLLRFPVHPAPTSTMKQIGGAQTLNVNPGLRELEIKLMLEYYLNLFNPDLTSTGMSVNAEPVLSTPRQWWGFANASVSYPLAYRGKPFRNIANSIYRLGYDITTGVTIMNGLITRFRITAQSDTELEIKFKFGVTNMSSFFALGLNSEKTINFYWYLCTYEPVYADRDFYWLNPATEAYELVLDGDPEVNYNTLIVTGADFDQSLLTYEGSFTIPIGTVTPVASAGNEDMDLIFKMGTEICQQSGEIDKPANSCYYGDFVAIVNETPMDNLLRGTVVTDFKDKKTISLEMFDAGYGYRNSIYRYLNQYSYELAEDWTYDGVTMDSLANWFLKTKFRLYRIARQTLEISYYIEDWPTMPLTWSWIDTKQANKIFIQLGVIHRPESNIQICQLYEYDNTEVINLV